MPCVRCYADRYYFAAVNYDGKVYKCTGKDYNDLNVAGKILEDGRLIWDNKIISKIYARPNFDKEVCLACKHLPICIGSCHQNSNLITCPIDGELSPEDFIVDIHKKRILDAQDILQAKKNETGISDISS